MKMAIAGAGMIVHDLFRFIHDVNGIELTAIASTPKSIEKVKSLAEENGIPAYYADYDALLTDPNTEVMYVATPNNLHYEMVKKALNKGLHVICEKPFTSNIEELEELRDLAKEKGLILLEAISTQYLPNALKMKEMIEEIGDPKIVIANYSQYSSRYNAFKEGKVLPAFSPDFSGGALMDLNIYNIHLITMLFGAPKEVTYAANIEKGIDTSGIISLDYDNFKAVLVGAKDCKAPITTSIQGNKGAFIIEGPANVLPKFKLVLNDGTVTEYDLQEGTHRMFYEFEQFADIIDRKDYARADAMMEKSLIAMDTATKARRSGNVVFPADEPYIS